MDKLLIQNARVYQNGKFVRADVLCGDALIAKIGENLTDEEARASFRRTACALCRGSSTCTRMARRAWM